MKILKILNSNFRQLFWFSVAWLVVYPLLFIFAVFPAVQDFVGVSAYFIALALYILPTILVLVLALLGLVQMFKKQRGILNALGHFLVAVLTLLGLMMFFFFLTFATFGFS